MIEKIKSTIESHMAALDESWLKASAEAILDPELPIVDPHHHFWDYSTHRYLLEQLLADTGSGHKIETTVFIRVCSLLPTQRKPRDAGGRRGGVRQRTSRNGSQRAIRRYAGGCRHRWLCGSDPCGAKVEEVLNAQVAVGGGRFKGIRHAAGWENKTAEIHNSHTNPPQHLYRDHTMFREGFAKLGELGLSFDAWLYHPQIEDLIDLARSFPNQPIVLNHVGALSAYNDWTLAKG